MIVFLLVTLVGLCFGSFVSAVTYRYPKGISFIGGRSFCPKCKKQIEWYDNIPLLSFFTLGGRCRDCKRPISWRYPVIELTTALGFLAIVTLLPPANLLQAIYSIIVFLILEVIFVTDFEHQIIPDDFVFVGFVLIFFYLLFFNQPFIFSSLLAGFLAATLLMIIHLVTKGRGMGLGDVKFAVMGGMIVGLKLTMVWLFAAFLTGGITGIILILGRRAGLKDKIAFGPFLIIGLLITLLYGVQILNVIGFQR